MEKDYIIFQENGLFGAKSQTGEIIIKPQYIEMQPFSCGLSQVRNNKYHYAYVNAANKQIVPFGRYIWCDPYFVCGLARVKQNDKWGIINTLGQEIIPVICDNIWSLKARYIHAIKVFYKGKEQIWDINTFLKENILDGLIYHHTYTIEEIKKIFEVPIIEIKEDLKKQKLFFMLSTIKGEVAGAGLPINPVISIVSNVNGKIFPLLHEADDTDKTSFAIPHNKFVNNLYRRYEMPHYNEEWEDLSYYDGWSREDVENGLADAFEGDTSNYWNID